MSKVLYLFDALKRGGAETSTLEIIRRFNCWEPVIVSIYRGTEMKAEFETQGVPVYSLDVKRQFSIPSTLRKINRIIEREKPDLIHSNLFMADQFARYLGKKKSIPVVNSFVNDSYSKERYELLNLKQRLVLDVYKAIDRSSAKRVTKYMSLTQAIVCNNSNALDIDPREVAVIPRGRNIERFRQRVDPETVADLKMEYGPGPVILTVSRLLIRKGYLEAVRAIKEVVKKYPKVKYLVAGKGHDETAIKHLIKESSLEENIILLGSRSDVPSLLAAADIFLFPSHYEGQGGALVEAMLMEKKIVATRIPVLEESVQDKFSALLFNYRDAEDMTDKIIWAIENPQEMNNFAANAKREAERRFRIEGIAQRHEELYDDVLNKHSELKG